MKLNDKLTITNEDNLDLLARLKDHSVDIICIDPPYLYLKNQKLEVPFCFDTFFSECKRVLTKNGSLIMFGRGVSFWEMNLKLHELGFKFKEEVIWNKRRNTSPVLPLGRCHESISIFQLGVAKINDVKIDCFEKNEFEPEKVYRIIERLNSAFGNKKSFDLLKKYFDTGFKKYVKSEGSNFSVSLQKGTGINQDRAVQFATALVEGQKEQSIIDCLRDHYNTIHPTQKPVKLLVRLINLVLPPNKDVEEVVVADFFGGSMSTMRAVHDIGCQGISCELHEDYYTAGIELTKKYLRNNVKQLKMF